MPTYLLSWDSPLSSRTLLALQALCFLSWAPAWPLAAQEMAGHSFVLSATLDSPCLEGNQVSPSLKEPQALHPSRYQLYPEVSDGLPCGHPWASTAPHGPECLVAIHALEPVWKGEKEAQPTWGLPPTLGLLVFWRPQRQIGRPPPERPPGSGGFTFPKRGEVHSSPTLSHPGPQLLELTFQSLQPLGRVGTAKGPAAQRSFEGGGAKPSPKRS